MIYLNNGILRAAISEEGAEIKSLQKDGYEYIWSGDARVWGNTAPVLFPILCSLKDGRYTLHGKTYEMSKHGFLRGEMFTVESADETSVTMLYTQNERTRKMYPFDFSFRAVFTLKENALEVEYRVQNQNDTEMYFSVGAHEAYATPEGVEDYDIVFPESEDLETVLVDANGLLQNKTMTVGKGVTHLPIYDKYFLLDTLIFRNLKSKDLILRNRKTGREIHVAYPDCDYLAIWHKPSAGYLCIEPWSGLPDRADTDGDLTHKEGILTLAPRAAYRNVHRITV